MQIFRRQNTRQLKMAMQSLENIPDGVYWVDEALQIVYVNKTSCDMLGYTIEELTNMNVMDIDITPEYYDSDDYYKLMNRIKNGEIKSYRAYHKHRDGHAIPVEIMSASVAIENYNLGVSIARDITKGIAVKEELEKSYNHIDILNHIYEFYYKSDMKKDIPSLFKEAIQEMETESDFFTIVAHLYSDDLNELSICNSINLDRNIVAPIYVFCQKLILKSISSHSPFIECKEDFESSSSLVLSEYNYANYYFFPVYYNRRILGGISILSKLDKDLNQKDIELAVTICSQLSTMFNNILLYDNLNKELENHKETELLLKQANDELQNYAHYDQLTNVWNRRCFLENINGQIQQIKEEKGNISLLLLDIDDFKQVNDSYGHSVGDIVLVEFAKLLTENIRAGDFLTRWGGEEFLILAPHMDSHNAMLYANRLRILISDHPFYMVKKVTVSIGVARLGEDESFEHWFSRVDDALYKAKENNKNSVVLSTFS